MFKLTTFSIDTDCQLMLPLSNSVFLFFYGSANVIKNQLRFATVIDRSLLPRFYGPHYNTYLTKR